MTICPKCRYQRQPSEVHVHQGVCPNCGIAYAKYSDADRGESGPAIDSDITNQNDFEPLAQRLWHTFTQIPVAVEPAAFWGRAAIYLAFVVWGCSFISGGINWDSIGGSFMHNINLPFHEFGHVLFGMFGNFIGILGGSVFQVLLPLIVVFAFSIQMQDNFAASICLWWCGQNFIDLSPYIADAPHRQLPLILGMSEDYHDWGNLLVMTNLLDKASLIASTSFLIGATLILISFVWGGWILRQQYNHIS